MGTKLITCSSCNGSGQETDSNNARHEGNYVHYGTKTCYSCGGTGQNQIYVPDPPVQKKQQTVKSKQQSKKAVSQQSSKGKKTSSSSGLKNFFTFLGFIAGAVLGFQIEDGNWVAVLILGVIMAGLARVMYKLIIVVIVLIILYFIFVGQ